MKSYEDTLKDLKLDTLSKRREKLCLKFALKLEKNPKFTNWFVRNTNTHLRNPKKYIEPYARTNKFYNSPILYLTRIMNNHYSEAQTR